MPQANVYGIWIYSDICFCSPHLWWEGFALPTYVCVFVRVNLFALSTRGVFWWTLSHPEQKRQQVLSSAACFLTIPPPPKGVTFSPCFVGLCILLFSIVPIWSSLIFPAGQTHCSTAADPMGAMFQTAAHFHTASTCAVGGGGRWPWCLFISSLTNIFITALKNNGRKNNSRAMKVWQPLGAFCCL